MRCYCYQAVTFSFPLTLPTVTGNDHKYFKKKVLKCIKTSYYKYMLMVTVCSRDALALPLPILLLMSQLFYFNAFSNFILILIYILTGAVNVKGHSIFSFYPRRGAITVQERCRNGWNVEVTEKSQKRKFYCKE